LARIAWFVDNRHANALLNRVPVRRHSVWPRSCVWRTTPWARSPARSRRMSCWGWSSAASASAS